MDISAAPASTSPEHLSNVARSVKHAQHLNAIGCRAIEDDVIAISPHGQASHARPQVLAALAGPRKIRQEMNRIVYGISNLPCGGRTIATDVKQDFNYIHPALGCPQNDGH